MRRCSWKGAGFFYGCFDKIWDEKLKVQLFPNLITDSSVSYIQSKLHLLKGPSFIFNRILLSFIYKYYFTKVVSKVFKELNLLSNAKQSKEGSWNSRASSLFSCQAHTECGSVGESLKIPSKAAHESFQVGQDVRRRFVITGQAFCFTGWGSPPSHVCVFFNVNLLSLFVCLCYILA